MSRRGAGARAIVLDGRRVEYRVRRSPRAKSLRLRVAPGVGLEVVAPQRGKLPAPADLEKVLRERAGWIIAALDRVAAQVAAAPPAPRVGGVVLYRGAEYRLAVEVAPGERAAVRLDEARRTLTMRLPSRGEAELRGLLAGWYRARAREALEARAAHFAAKMGLSYDRLMVRDQRSRWGSCSSLGNLNFNWRLILAPPGVLDYVVVHELAHRREPNHSPRFWALVAAHCPDYRAHQAWLKEHGAALMQDGAG